MSRSDVLGGFIDGTTGGSEFYPTTFEVQIQSNLQLWKEQEMMRQKK